MTKETASTLLTQIFNTYGNIITANYKDGVIKEAFEMAIKALKSDTPPPECQRCKWLATEKCRECFGNELFTDSGYVTTLTDCAWGRP